MKDVPTIPFGVDLAASAFQVKGTNEDIEALFRGVETEADAVLLQRKLVSRAVSDRLDEVRDEQRPADALAAHIPPGYKLTEQATIRLHALKNARSRNERRVLIKHFRKSPIRTFEPIDPRANDALIL